jgi:hypothetical protein
VTDPARGYEALLYKTIAHLLANSDVRRSYTCDGQVNFFTVSNPPTKQEVEAIGKRVYRKQ